MSGLITVFVFLEVFPPTIGGDSNRELSSKELSKMLGSLVIRISADPQGLSSAPLNDVDLTVTLPPTVTGNITYRFDCTDDGTWEKTITTRSSEFTAVDICDYPSSGDYTARVQAITETLTLENTVDIAVFSRSLSVSVFPHPSSGTAPLNGVDLVGDVSGTVTGDILYKFDCTSDGIWEWQETVSTGSQWDTMMAEDLCDYPNPGIYRASMRAERGGLAMQTGAGIMVFEP